MPIQTDRETLALDLRTYGEDELAARVASMSDEDLRRVFDRADDYLYQDESGLIARALAGAAVEVLEGRPRPLSRSRRRLKGVLPETLPRRATPADAEPPRDVFAAAAAQVAARFAPDGWRYARSGPHLSRADGPFTFQLHLTTSAYNEHRGARRRGAGPLSRTQAMAPGTARRRGLRGCRRRGAAAQPRGRADPVRLEPREPRDARRGDRRVVEHIERLALPWFATFADTETLVQRLRAARLPNISPANAIDLLVWLGHPDAAEAHARARLAEHPEIARTYEQERLRLSGRTDLGAVLNNVGADVARAVHAHGLRP